METNTDLQRLKEFKKWANDEFIWDEIHENGKLCVSPERFEGFIDSIATKAFDLGQMLEADKCKNHD